MLSQATHVVVEAPAPLPLGDEIEVWVVQHEDDKSDSSVVVRHVASSVMYGAKYVLDDRPMHPIIGNAQLYRAPRLRPRWHVAQTFHARVRECVVSNVPKDTGNGDWITLAVTSLLVEPTVAAPVYR